MPYLTTLPQDGSRRRVSVRRSAPLYLGAWLVLSLPAILVVRWMLLLSSHVISPGSVDAWERLAGTVFAVPIGVGIASLVSVFLVLRRVRTELSASDAPRG